MSYKKQLVLPSEGGVAPVVMVSTLPLEDRACIRTCGDAGTVGAIVSEAESLSSLFGCSSYCYCDFFLR